MNGIDLVLGAIAFGWFYKHLQNYLRMKDKIDDYEKRLGIDKKKELK